MPTIALDKARFFNELGRTFTDQELDDLCFEYGLEIDENSEEEVKIEVPANRYDLLCLEGIVLNLRVYLQKCELPTFKLINPPNGVLEAITVKPETARIRSLFTGAVLRNIKFTKDRYESFIALQDKLHSNLARDRSLVAIGTHDLDKIQGPFTYEALPPEKIRFIPLNQRKEMNAREMMGFYEKDQHLKKFLPIIRDSEVYPVIYDRNRTVLSMPPIINGDISKITLDTRNVFIDVTAVDTAKTKIDIVINIMVTMFSMYCAEPFTVEPINIKSPHNNQSCQAPDLSPRRFTAEVAYLNSASGLSLDPPEMCKLLKLMGHVSKPSEKDPNNELSVEVPPTRADVLHQVDIMKDLAVAYGFNKLEKQPRFLRSITFSSPLAIGELTEIVRNGAAKAGWTEVLTFILCAHDENFAWLKRKDVNADGSGALAIRLQNPKTTEYQVPRTSLIPGLLKSLKANTFHRLPIKIFEASDVTFQDLKKERKARNQRNFAGAFCGKVGGFEEVHGLLDDFMDLLNCPFLTYAEVHEKTADGKPKFIEGYWIEAADQSTFMQGFGAAVHLRKASKNQTVGALGTLHPDVLNMWGFKVDRTISVIEINMEPFA